MSSGLAIFPEQSSERLVAENQLIIEQTKTTNQGIIYFIKKGSVGLYKRLEGVSNDNEQLVMVFKEGDYISHSLLSHSSDACDGTTYVKTIQPCSLLQIEQPLSEESGDSEFHLHILKKTVDQLSASLLEKNELIEHKKQSEQKLKKNYDSLGHLSTNLLSFIAIYTLLLVTLTQVVDYLGASTLVDVMLISGFAIIMYLMMRKSGHTLSSYGVTFNNWKQQIWTAVVLTCPVLILFLGVKWVLITFVPAYSHLPLFNPAAAFVDTSFSYALYALTVGIYIVFSVVQEFIARAGLQSSFEKFLPQSKHRTIKAIVLSNLIFAMAHAHIGFAFALVAFIPGLYWGWMFARHRSLISVSVSHMLIGIWVLFILGFTDFVM